MNAICSTIQNRISYIDDILGYANKVLSSAPKGRLRATMSKNHLNFYIRTDPKSANGRYLKKSEDKIVQALAQKEYLEKVAKRAVLERGLLSSLLSFYQKAPMEAASDEIHLYKRARIKPLFFSDEEYAEQWQMQDFVRNKLPGDDELVSDRGEKMRSKSEVLIANALNRHHVPYHYERPLEIDGKTIYPDFTVLNVRHRREYYWEHFGMMSDSQYASNFTFKLSRYMANGIFPGKNLLISLESENQKFGTKQIKAIIQEYLLS